ncbi:MAG: segregation/condensation protein A [Rhodospirillaceae bacterium]|jgi:segregation and condensation protein A|nr:segregation/condensation protein A [Rhodospirillaceae bacterium]MBT3884168.1 segregation/condensation protein A [Rhodospirillaceae bacterium]MBT4115306.1 segregation/condensation protein A [Rhodospirillaceae bacterium]MBT4674432.1 segregation/condensation protein A [Rhodospirillaceae bacterium]MBT4721014.1 segregation/condensation protein A [Rhodospirillaceae bacterium]
MADEFDDFEMQERPVAGSGLELVVDLGGFEGPLDVLLTLARNQKVDVTQLSILELADQYLAWVARVRSTNLELAADYLVMAAWLAYLKSRLLLPELNGEDEPTGEEMAAALAFQMRRLESMQEAGERIMARPRLGQDFFANGMPEKFGYASTSVYEVSLFDLLSAYGEHTHRSNIRTLRIEPSELYSPDDAMKILTDMLGRIPDWSNLMQFLPEELRGDLVSRSMLASTFVAALHLAKEGKLSLRQNQPFESIFVRQTESD